MPPPQHDHYARLSDDNLRLRALQALSGSNRSLEEAEIMFRQLLSRDLDPYTRGWLLQRLWTVEQRLGRYRCYFSQAGQDRLVDQDLFKGKSDGVFVEIGGYDGVNGSNCLFLEKFRNWRGVVVEASPGLADQISQVRGVPVVHAAICGHDGTAELMEITGGLRQMSGLIGSYNENILERVRHDPRHQEQQITVPAMRLETLLATQGLGRVDYCSIDVEGAERTILTAVDFKNCDISVISIENATNSEAESLRDIMAPAGYRLVAVIGADEIWSRL